MSSIVALFLALVMGLTGGAQGAAELAPRWPGHQPGKVILGMSCGSHCQAREAQLGMPYGVHRQFTKWGEWDEVIAYVRADHAHDRLPWVSVEGPYRGAPWGWRAVADGDFDSEIRALAAAIKADDDQPILLTFHHEPSNDASEAQGVLWAAAFSRFCDVLDREGALANTSCVPILGDWLFNPANKAQDPADWVTKGVLRRAAFLGVDVYENASGTPIGPRLERILGWMAAQGFPDKMVGVGEMGGTDAHYAGRSSVEFLNQSLAWAAANTDKIGVISYFNSTANSRAKVHWPLDENPQKLATFRRWLRDDTIAN